MATSRKMTKTEQVLLEKLATRRHRQMCIETLADGRRKYRAAVALVEKGLVTLVKEDKGYVPVRHGSGRHAYWRDHYTYCLVIAHKEPEQGQA